MQPQALSGQPKTASPTQSRWRQFMLRKIWLPRSAYAALPYLYVFLGAYAMAAALFLSHWSWIVPYLVLLGIGCVHTGAILLSLRWKNRRGDSVYQPKPPQQR